MSNNDHLVFDWSRYAARLQKCEIRVDDQGRFVFDELDPDYTTIFAAEIDPIYYKSGRRRSQPGTREWF